MVRVAGLRTGKTCKSLKTVVPRQSPGEPTRKSESQQAQHARRADVWFRGRSQRKIAVSAQACRSVSSLLSLCSTQPLDWVRSTCIIEGTLLSLG